MTLFLLVALAGCGSGADTGVRAQLAKARLQWTQSQPTRYQLMLRRACFCPLEFAGPASVTVSRGVVETPNANFTEIDTVEEQFALIETTLDDPSQKIEVLFDPAQGYPKNISISSSQVPPPADDGYGITTQLATL